MRVCVCVCVCEREREREHGLESEPGLRSSYVNLGLVCLSYKTGTAVKTHILDLL